MFMYYIMDTTKINQYVINNIPIEFKIYAIYTTTTIYTDIEELVQTQGTIINTQISGRAKAIFDLTKNIKSEAIKYLKYYITYVVFENNAVADGIVSSIARNNVYTDPNDTAIKKIPLTVIQDFIKEVLDKSHNETKFDLNKAFFTQIQKAIAGIQYPPN